MRDLGHLTHLVKADDGEKGSSRDCTGKNAKHRYVDVRNFRFAESMQYTVVQ